MRLYPSASLPLFPFFLPIKSIPYRKEKAEKGKKKYTRCTRCKSLREKRKEWGGGKGISFLFKARPKICMYANVQMKMHLYFVSFYFLFFPAPLVPFAPTFRSLATISFIGIHNPVYNRVKRWRNHHPTPVLYISRRMQT